MTRTQSGCFWYPCKKKSGHSSLLIFRIFIGITGSTWGFLAIRIWKRASLIRMGEHVFFSEYHPIR